MSISTTFRTTAYGFDCGGWASAMGWQPNAGTIDFLNALSPDKRRRAELRCKRAANNAFTAACGRTDVPSAVEQRAYIYDARRSDGAGILNLGPVWAADKREAHNIIRERGHLGGTGYRAINLRDVTDPLIEA